MINKNSIVQENHLNVNWYLGFTSPWTHLISFEWRYSSALAAWKIRLQISFSFFWSCLSIQSSSVHFHNTKSIVVLKKYQDINRKYTSLSSKIILLTFVFVYLGTFTGTCTFSCLTLFHNAKHSASSLPIESIVTNNLSSHLKKQQKIIKANKAVRNYIIFGNLNFEIFCSYTGEKNPR